MRMYSFDRCDHPEFGYIRTLDSNPVKAVQNRPTSHPWDREDKIEAHIEAPPDIC
jgi:hypothetical protein